jgi:hypothetical protein
MRRFQESAASGHGFFLNVGGLNLAFSTRVGLGCDFVVGLKHLTPQLYEQLLPSSTSSGRNGRCSLALSSGSVKLVLSHE